MIKQGNNGAAVIAIQILLSFESGYAMYLDGSFGPATKQAVINFQKRHKLEPDGVVGPMTLAKLSKYNPVNKFIVFLDAGHGGWDGVKNYTDPKLGKFAKHHGEQLHDGKGMYYEGHENRVIVDGVFNKLRSIGINALRTAEPLNDTQLKVRTDIVKSWLSAGHSGYFHSFHSNASPDNTLNDDIRGACVFTSVGHNISDRIADWHYENMYAEFGGEFVWRMDKSDGDTDFEANFWVIKNAELQTSKFGAILEEFGFHTSVTDCKFITRPDVREKRINCAVETAKEVIKNKITDI